ncbi:DUF5329 domain-containing protein [Pseudomaricurvus alkylphenolicus]|uniref:DUF5329 family protein n=1 Tax=Pseudomaricurvus alkylphenolicus TaxID=1306991 RepID=UPI00197DAF35|nr:DUF5329 domain-containing protein [Pseudomaricurvus alkylphenolicus]
MGKIKPILLIATLLLTQGVVADNTKRDIAHLLDFVAASDCTFIRNGSEHAAKDAVSHIRKKFDYYKRDIDTAEAFIALSASQSTFSKKPYTVKCPGTGAIPSQHWLLAELRRYRGAPTP